MLKRIILFLTLSLCLPMALVDTILSASPPPEFIPQMSIHIQEAQQKSGAPVIPFRKGFGSLLYQEQATTGLRTKLRKKVIGFYPHWIPSPVVQWNNLTHLAYFSCSANVDGSLTCRGWPDSFLIKTARENNTKVLLTIDNFYPAQLDTILGNPQIRDKLINNIVSTVLTPGGNGIVIDFEFPNSNQSSNFTVFVRSLITKMKAVNSKSEIMIVTPAIDLPPYTYDYPTLADITDGLIMMAYGYFWSGSTTAGPTSPLESGKLWGSFNVARTVDDYLTATNGKANKLILGVPYYGQDWPTVSQTVPSNTTGTAIAQPYWVLKKMADQNGRRWDINSKTPWISYLSGTQSHQAWYDDAESLSLKYDFVNNRDLEGISIWALGYDSSRPELWQTIANAFSTPIGDINNDGRVNTIDLGLLLPYWNQIPPISQPALDINGDGVVNSLDASVVLSQWKE